LCKVLILAIVGGHTPSIISSYYNSNASLLFC